jgi:hypothetical protein
VGRKFTLQYPLAVGSQGLKRDESSASQLRVLSTVVKQQWAVNPRYGFPPFGFEQGSMEPDAESLLILFFTAQAIRRWVRSVALITTALEKDPTVQRRRILQILYLDRAGLDPKAPQLLPVGLDFLNG